MFTPSPQQQAVIDWVRQGSGSAFVEAVAGAGKTTTLVEAIRETQGTVAFAAYNKKIADEIKAKVAPLDLGARVRIGTFHSFGLAAWRRVYPNVKVDEQAKQLDTIAKFRAVGAARALDIFTLKLVSLAKQQALGLFGSIEDRSIWHRIVDHHDLADDIDETGYGVDDFRGAGLEYGDVSVETGIELAIRTLKYHREMSRRVVNFDDMIYMPAVANVRVWGNDWVFVDEAQDTNLSRMALARKMLIPSGRSVWVGDRAQAIYGWCGADSGAIDRITSEFNCTMLPLTVTYRCPKVVVAEARKLVSHIEAHETAPIGSLSVMEYDGFIDRQFVKGLDKLDVVLCRKTQPLVSLAYDLIGKGVACHVEGKDIGTGLLKLIDRFSKTAADLDDLRHKLEDWSVAEQAKLLAKGKETAAETIGDRVNTIIVVMESSGAATVVELRYNIKSMFRDEAGRNATSLTLSTVHKAKGREWERVFILGWADFMPSKWARQPWQQEQERNVMYVAVTRAKSKLILVNNVH